jgi:bacteriophage exclusion system BrxC/D-like protein
VVSKETPLSDPARVFEAAVRAATLPDRHDDAITGALTILRQSRDKMASLETAVDHAGDALAPIFSALLFLLQRETLPAGFARQMERFLAGGKIRPADVRQALAAVGGTRKFDLKLPAVALLMEQRIQFLTALLHAAGYAGWCLLFDEVELIGRYTPLRRALAYAWLATWLSLEGARSWPGIVAAYAITDDFVTAVIDERDDRNRLPDRLKLKERHHEAQLASIAMAHIMQTVRTRRLRVPGTDELVSASLRLSKLYQEAYDWEPPATDAPERTATRTMRQYIKGWITEWDMLRLTGDVTHAVAEEMTANYTEDENLSTLSEDEPES